MADSSVYTPETVARRLQIAQGLLNAPAQPIHHWAEGLNELLKGYTGGQIYGNAERAEREGTNAQAALVASILGAPGAGGAATPSVPPAPTAGSPMPTPAAPVPPMRAGTPSPLPPAAMGPMANPNDPNDPTISIPPSQVARANAPQPGSSAPITPTPVPTTSVPPNAPPSAPGASPAQMSDARSRLAAILSDPNANPYVRRAAQGLAAPVAAHILTPKDTKTVVANGNVYGFNPNNNQLTLLGTAPPRPTPEMQNRETENASRRARGLPELSITEFHQAQASAQERGKEQGAAQIGLDPAIAQATIALDTIKKLREHPGRQYATGILGGLPTLPGTPQRGFETLLNQARGQVFLDAYQGLRGGGQITEAEGRKAEAAKARLDRAQNADDFNSALSDLESVIRSGVERARVKAAGGAGNPAAGASSQGVRTYNPATGRIE